MRYTRCAMLLILVLAKAAPGAAAPYPNVYGAPPEVLRGSDWFRQCLRVRDAKPPRQQLPAQGQAQRCDAAALYGDALDAPDTGAADWRRVHACALRTDAHGVLAMLYANGEGAAPNLALATRHACSIQSPVNEMKSRVQRLGRLAKDAGRGRFDLCDDVAGAALRSACGAVRTGRQNQQHEQGHAAQLATLARGWSDKAQLGLALAREAAQHFARYRLEYELYGPGTGSRAARPPQREAQGAEFDRFAADVLDFEAGRLPRFSDSEFASLEQKMDAAYQQWMLARPASQPTPASMHKDGVEKTQRAWLAYRDAMELFGAIRYPQVPGASWRALLTARRIRQLAALENTAGR